MIGGEVVTRSSRIGRLRLDHLLSKDKNCTLVLFSLERGLVRTPLASGVPPRRRSAVRSIGSIGEKITR